MIGQYLAWLVLAILALAVVVLVIAVLVCGSAALWDRWCNR